VSLLSGAPPPPSPRPRTPLWAGLLAFLVLAIAVVVWLRREPPAAAPSPAAPALARPKPAPTPTPETSPALTRRPRAAAAPAPAPRRAPLLRVTADVPGAAVFLDRRHVGVAPVEIDDVSPGPHRVNVSAEGYEMFGETVEVGDEPTELNVRFREVRLDEVLPVVHKHGMGSCSGRLVATTAGLAYEADKQEDGFSFGFDRLEPLVVDYLKKNLRVKVRGGRTYNFTDPRGDADALFVFQKKVEDARRRLGGGS
jgi:hypothetical protein